MLNFIISFILLLLNLLAGLIFTDYEWANVGYSSTIIIINALLIYVLQTTTLKDAFRISLSFILSTLGLIEFILAIIAPSDLADNGYIFGAIGLIIIQSILLLIVNYVSKRIS